MIVAISQSGMIAATDGHDYLFHGRSGIVPPLGVDFETALGALLRTPPPPAGDKATLKAVTRKKRKRG